MPKWRTPQHRFLDPLKREMDAERPAAPDREDKLLRLHTIARTRTTRYVETVLAVAFMAQRDALITAAHEVIESIQSDRLRMKTAETLTRRIVERWSAIIPLNNGDAATLQAGLLAFVFAEGRIARGHARAAAQTGAASGQSRDI